MSDRMQELYLVEDGLMVLGGGPPVRAPCGQRSNTNTVSSQMVDSPPIIWDS